MSTDLKQNVEVVKQFPGRAAAILLTVLFVASLYGATYYLRADDSVKLVREWTGVKLSTPVANPVKYAVPVRYGDGLLFETLVRSQDVRAIMNGKVVEAGRGILKMVPATKDDATFVYTGLSSIVVSKDQDVKCGQKIGSIEPNDPYPGVARLHVQEQIGNVMSPPPQSVPAVFERGQTGEGHRIFTAACAGCHDFRRTGKLIEHGKLMSGGAASPTSIRDQIRGGGGRMPAFPREVLSDSELDAVTAFLLARR